MAVITPQCVAGDDEDINEICGKPLCCATYDEERDLLALVAEEPCEHCAWHFDENCD